MAGGAGMALKQKTCSIWLLILILGGLGAACSANSITGETLELTNFYILETTTTGKETSLCSLPRMTLFKPYDHKILPHKDDRIDRCYIFRVRFTLPEALAGQTLFLHVPPLAYPAHITLNGEPIALSGNGSATYVSSQFYAQMALLPRTILKKDNEVCIVIVPRGERVALAGFVIGPYEPIASLTFWKSFFNYAMICGFVVLSALYSLLFIGLWITGARKDKKYFLFGCTTLAICVGYLEIVFGYPAANEVLLWQLSRIGLNLTVIFLLMYALHNNGYLTRKIEYALWAIIVAVVIAFGMCGSKFAVAQVFAYTSTMIILPGLLAVFFIFAQSFYRRRGLENAFLVIGIMTMIAAGLHDLYYSMKMVFPFAWLTPYGYLVLEFSIALVLTLEQGSMLRLVEAQSTSLRREMQQRIDAQTKLEELNRELENRVRQRTSELEFAIHELESFNYSVSHDLRSPLHSIAGLANILKVHYQNKLDSNGTHHLDSICASVFKMNDLINNLLQLSRVSGTELSVKSVDLSAMAERIVETLMYQNRGREIISDIKAGMVVMADEQLLEIALQNLLGNAVKYTAKKDQAIIQVGTEYRDGREVFFIADNGAGFDMAKSEKLFDAFHRMHRNDEFPGTGIGLSIVKRIIVKHKGSIWAQSQVDQGATFYFTLQADAV